MALLAEARIELARQEAVYKAVKDLPAADQDVARRMYRLMSFDSLRCFEWAFIIANFYMFVVVLGIWLLRLEGTLPAVLIFSTVILGTIFNWFALCSPFRWRCKNELAMLEQSHSHVADRVKTALKKAF